MKAEERAILYRALQDVVEVGTSRRVPPASIAGTGKTLSDLVSSLVEEADWEWLKGSFSTATFGFGGSISSSGDFRKADGGRLNRLAGSGYRPFPVMNWPLRTGGGDCNYPATQSIGLLLPCSLPISSFYQ